MGLTLRTASPPTNPAPTRSTGSSSQRKASTSGAKTSRQPDRFRDVFGGGSRNVTSKPEAKRAETRNNASTTRTR